MKKEGTAVIGGGSGAPKCPPEGNLMLFYPRKLRKKKMKLKLRKIKEMNRIQQKRKKLCKHYINK